MYIAEVAPPAKRGFLVTFNQLNIVTGISVAYFSNYFVLRLVQDPAVNWRVMLGVGTIPALLYLLLLLIVPESPRWLVQRGRDEEALAIMKRVGGEEHAASEYQQIKKSLASHTASEGAAFGELLSKRMRFVMFIGLVIAFFQQVSGINAILYYAPMIFEMAGGGKEAAFLQAVILGLVNFGMTIVSMFLIDRLGRKPLLLIGSLLMAVSLLTASFAFRQARYELTSDAIAKASAAVVAQAGDASAVARAQADAAAMSAVLVDDRRPDLHRGDGLLRPDQGGDGEGRAPGGRGRPRARGGLAATWRPRPRSWRGRSPRCGTRPTRTASCAAASRSTPAWC